MNLNGKMSFCKRSFQNDSHGRRLLWRLADEELMLFAAGDNQSEMMSVNAGQPCESSAERLPIISHLFCSKWLMLTATPLFSFPLSYLSLSGLWSTWMWREQVCGFVEPNSWPMTGWREELREREEGIEKREGGILCNRVENTKERQTHAFVIFVFLHPLPPPPVHLLFPASLFLVADLNPLTSESPSGSRYQQMLHKQTTNIPSVLYCYLSCNSVLIRIWCSWTI